MKYMIASDIHGSAFYCKQMLEAFNRENADKLILLGDILYHGPRNDLPLEYEPKKVIAMLNEIKQRLLCVRGNCDSEVDQMVLEFPIMADYGVIPLRNKNLYFTHGHKFNKISPMPLSKGDILLCGHTHIPACDTFGNDNIYLNPGSVSLPKNDTYHGYMILEDDRFLFKTLDGEVCRETEI